LPAEYSTRENAVSADTAAAAAAVYEYYFALPSDSRHLFTPYE